MSSKSEGRVELNSMMSMYSIYEGTKAPAENAAGLYGFIAKSTYQGMFPIPTVWVKKSTTRDPDN